MGGERGVIAEGAYVELLGRDKERAHLDQVVAAVHAGDSRVLVLRGEPGSGKSALLDYAGRSAQGIRVLPAFGVESETELEFAAVHQLCLPLLDRLSKLPDPQRTALETVFGREPGPAPDPFLVALAVLGLLSHAAEEGPLLCVVDDADWLDHPSAQVLAFVARRLRSEPIAILFATRRPEPHLAGLPELEISGLDDAEALTLLGSVTPAGLDPHIRDRVIAEARGNPRALLELPHGLTPTQVASGLGLLSADTEPGRIEQGYLDRIQTLPAPTRLLLLVAAAEPAGDPHLVREAVHRLGLKDETGLTDSTDGVDALIRIDGRVTFGHPLVRSAAYRAASAKDRRAAHRALAAVTNPKFDADRRAWHRAAAAAAPDEAVAVELERSATRAQVRGGLGAAAAFLQRSVVLTEDMTRHADRALAAADASLQAGDVEAARHFLEAAERSGHDDRQLARTQLLRGRLAVAVGRPQDAARVLLAAARRLERFDPDLARDTCLEAWGAAVAAADGAGLLDACQAIEALPEPLGEPRLVDRLLSGYASLVHGRRAAGVDVLQRAVPALADVRPTELLQWGRVAGGVGPSVWDDVLMVSVLQRLVQASREAGAMRELSLHLSDLALTTAWTGDLTSARSLVAEADQVAIATGTPLAPNGALWLAALVGHEADGSALIGATIDQAAADGQGRGVAVARWSSAVLFNGLGKYKQAAAAARAAAEVAQPWTSVWALPELVEAAARTGDAAQADHALGRLLEATQPCETDWARGISARCRALVSAAPEADELFTEAIERLGRTQWRPEQARADLLYGEWLRRQGRRVVARKHLRRAHEMLTSFGMEAFAERARRELIATGESVRKRSTGPASAVELTPQEMQIAVLVREGYSNPEVGARLFLSPRTVEWHLGKVFAKLSISSRRQLRDALLRDGSGQGA